MGGVKSNIAVYNNRVHVVMEMLLSGLRRKIIIENIANNEKLRWNVTTGQIDNYIAAANKEILVMMEADKDILKKKIFARYDYLYSKLVNVKDYKGAILALDKSAALAGVIAATKIESEVTFIVEVKED